MDEVPMQMYSHAQQRHNVPAETRCPHHVTRRGTSPIRKRLPPGPYSRPMPRALWWSWGGGRFPMSEVPLQSRSKGNVPTTLPTGVPRS